MIEQRRQRELEALFERHGYRDYRWIAAEQIVVAEWVRFKCLFGCGSYGQKGTCPPNTPPVEECRRFFAGYRAAALFHFPKLLDDPRERHGWSREVNSRLLELERAVFLAGWHKAFLLFMDECSLCADCPGTRPDCRDKASARPSPEALAVDVFATVRSVGYPIEVLADTGRTMNRYAFLLIE
jgi:predicted metal-binding protein